MLILGINGSPNKKGNTAFLIREALKEVEDANIKVKLISTQDALRGLDIPFCTACSNPCEGICYRGKYLEKVYELLGDADGIIIGSPVYFGTVSAQLKAFWDMSRKLRKENVLINTVGGVITVGASHGQETASKTIMDMMLIQGMTIVGDGLYENTAGHYGVLSKKPSNKDNNAILRAKILAKRVKEVAKITKYLRDKEKK
ncbi:MAG TPA: flavodoxin family protein [Candidatus Atribacteria bacterium]|nr:flavodoxin family protein [Candidatus Atribacteria bacterium]